MPEQQQYVAIRPLKFGGVSLQPGDPLPLEKGRSYHQMLSLGQIALAPAGGSGAALPEGSHQVLLHPNILVIFVDQDGVPEEVTYLGTQEPDEEARATLGLELGKHAALVKFSSDEEPSLVPLDSLISGEAAQRLVLHFQTQVDEVAAGRSAAQAQLTSATSVATTAQSQVEWLTLLLSAVKTEGEALPDDAPLLKELQVNGLSTRGGLHLVADGEHGRANLIRLDGIGTKSADKILAWLFPKPEGG